MTGRKRSYDEDHDNVGRRPKITTEEIPTGTDGPSGFRPDEEPIDFLHLFDEDPEDQPPNDPAKWRRYWYGSR